MHDIKFPQIPLRLLPYLIILHGIVHCELTKGPDDVLAVVGSTITLPCSTNLSVPVQWEFKRFMHEPDEPWELVYFGYPTSYITTKFRNKHRYSVTLSSTGNEYNLTINNLQTGDAGTYRCIDDYGFGGYEHDEGIPGHEYRADVTAICSNLTCTEGRSTEDKYEGINLIGQGKTITITCSVSYFGGVQVNLDWSVFRNTSSGEKLLLKPIGEPVPHSEGSGGCKCVKEEIKIEPSDEINFSYVKCNLSQQIVFNAEALKIEWISKPIYKDDGLNKLHSISHSVQAIQHGKQITSVTVMEGRIFVVEMYQGIIGVYDQESLIFIHSIKIPETKNGIISMTCSFHLKELYIVTSTGYVFRLDLDGKILSEWALQGGYHSRGISITSSHTVLITTQEGGLNSKDKKSLILEYNSDGKVLREIERDVTIQEPFITTELYDDHFIISHGHFTATHRVCIINSEGTILRSYGDKFGRGKGQLLVPRSLSVDEINRLIFVAEWENSRITVLNYELMCLGWLKSPMNFDEPFCLHYDSASETLYVGDGRQLFVIYNPINLITTSAIADHQGVANYPTI